MYIDNENIYLMAVLVLLHQKAAMSNLRRETQY